MVDHHKWGTGAKEGAIPAAVLDQADGAIGMVGSGEVLGVTMLLVVSTKDMVGEGE